GPYRVHLDHEGIVDGVDEEVVERFDRDRWRKRPELLTKLDPHVDDVAHVTPAWIREDAAITQRACTPLHASLEPANDVAVRNARGCPLTELLFARDARAYAVPRLDLRAPHVGRRRHRGIVELRAPVAVAHLEATLSTQLVPDVKRRAERGAVVARSGLNVEIRERRFRAHLAIRHAV